jgi:RimJ/RimL family protein N-acetyltransferase
LAPQELLRSLKATAGGSHQLCLVVGKPVVALLRPVATQPGRVDSGDVQCLTDWRNRHVSSFLTEFVATTKRTASWLTQTVNHDDTRILFMVEAPPGKAVGYMGMAFIDWAAGAGEADAVVRGEDAPRGLMTHCLRHLLGWARDQLGLHSLSVRVRSDNPALAFYEKFGFVETTRELLVRSERDGELVWQPGGSGPGHSRLSLVHMSLRDDALSFSSTPSPS